jgi:hypothetical protein
MVLWGIRILGFYWVCVCGVFELKMKGGIVLEWVIELLLGWLCVVFGGEIIFYVGMLLLCVLVGVCLVFWFGLGVLVGGWGLV